MEERDTEVRQLKMALREKEHDLERANHMLLTTEETIDVSLFSLLYCFLILNLSTDVEFLS